MRCLLYIAVLLLLIPSVGQAAFPDGWGYRAPVVLDYTKISSDESNFTVLLDSSNFPGPMLDLDGDSLSQSDGGDLRFSSDSAGSSRLACDVQVWSLNADRTASVAQVWVEMSSISASDAANDTVWVWWNTSGADTQPAVDATYGSEDTWSNSYLFVSHMEEASGTLVDETSGDHDFGVEGAPTFAEPGKIGDAILYNATTELHSRANTPAFDALSYLTVMGWIKLDGNDISGDWGRMFTNTNGTGSDCYYLGISTDPAPTPAARWTNSTNQVTTINDASPTLTDSVWYHLVSRHSVDTDSLKIYKAGAQVAQGFTSGTMKNAGGSDELGVGGHPRSSTRGIRGWLDEITVSSVARSTGWITTVYNNQSVPRDFAAEGTPIFREADGAADISYVRRIKEGEGK